MDARTLSEALPSARPARAGAGDVDLAAVFAAFPGATAVFAADPPCFTVLAASDALLTVTHRPREAVVGRPLAEAFPNASPEDPEAGGLTSLRGSLTAAVRTGAPQRMPRQRYDLQHPDGRWEERYWDAVNFPVPGPDGAVRYVLHQTEDVTARVLGEAAAARAERRAARILEQVSDAHLTLDREFRIVAVNAAAERALGKRREDMLERTHWEVFPASRDADAGRAYRRVVAEGVEQHLTQHYVGEGYDRHLEIDAYPTDDGGVAIFWRDVTKRVDAERAALGARDAAEAARQAAEAARADAEAANRSKSEFLAVMSHELRTPLNAIAGYAELMELGLHGPVTAEQRTALARIQKSQRHLLGLINEVLNYAKLESGAVAYAVQPTRVADVVAAVTPLIEPQRAAKRLALDVRLPEHDGHPPADVLADPEKLQQVLLNLLSNAVKFTPEGGRVTVTLDPAPDPEAAALLRVADTGIGVPVDKLGAIFEPFVQVRADLTRPHDGTGLGLAISRDLVRGMGGDLTAESTPGVGSTFTLTLPRA